MRAGCWSTLNSQLSTINPQLLSQTGKTESGGGLAHFGSGNLLGLAEGLVGGCEDHVFEHLRVARVQSLGIYFDRVNGTVALGDDLYGAAAAGRFNGAVG